MLLHCTIISWFYIYKIILHQVAVLCIIYRMLCFYGSIIVIRYKKILKMWCVIFAACNMEVAHSLPHVFRVLRILCYLVLNVRIKVYCVECCHIWNNLLGFDNTDNFYAYVNDTWKDSWNRKANVGLCEGLS